ncbi:T9SS type A sorting domain-containing protein, partial [candidate division KSB1 bacterium]|nr:T9SS type A sorting domain-containing protein [candidate division KSB1 bacterium]
ARVRGENDPAYDRVFDLQWHNGIAGTRDELRIWGADSTFELEKVDLKMKLGADLYAWHTIRIVVQGDLSTVYMDENPEPVISGVSTSSTTSKYIKVGDGSGEAIGGYMDWCILSLKGAFAPEEGPAIPEGLFVDKKEEPVEPDWRVYDGSILPTETGSEGDSLDLSNLADEAPGAGLIEEIIDDPDIAGNKIFKYLHPDGKRMYRHYFDDAYADSEFTMIARVRGENDPVYDRVFDLQWHNGNAGTRDELRLWGADSTFELEKVDLKVKLDVNLYTWHTIRIVVKGDLSTVYMDENSEPIVSGVSTSSTTAKYIKVGDGSGEAIGGYMDWFIVTLKGAFAPGEGPAIPEGLFVDTGEQPIVPKWLVYDASILPSETGSEGDSLDLTVVSDNSPGPGLVEEIIDDTDIEGNKLLKYLHPDGKKMYRHNFYEGYEDSAFTMMARVKGENDPAYDRVFDLQWRNGVANSRDELRIWPADSTLELEKADVELKVDMDLYGWHTYRIAIVGDLATIYIDEDMEPVISGISLESSSDKYIKVGDGSGEAIGGYIDWLILDTSGAFAPGEGLPIPEGLFVDKKKEPVVQKWMVYDASILPSETGSGGDSLDLSGLSQDAPGAGFVEEIMEDPEINGNKVLKYLQPSGTKMYRYSFDESYTGTSLTMIARVKGENDPTYDRVFDLQWRNANVNSRDELRIWGADKKLELEKSSAEVIVEFDPYAWHTYRIAVSSDTATIYVDENPVPVITGISTESSGDNYIKIGDGSGDTVGGYLDWCIVDMSGAYAPGEGLPIPEYLFVDTLVTKVQPLASANAPVTYELEQNYPNPFNPTTNIQFQLPKSGHVTLSVYDVTGRLVATLVDEKLELGRYTIHFDAARFASGIYFYRIKSSEFNDVKKMLLIK